MDAQGGEKKKVSLFKRERAEARQAQPSQPGSGATAAPAAPSPAVAHVQIHRESRTDLASSNPAHVISAGPSPTMIENRAGIQPSSRRHQDSKGSEGTSPETLEHKIERYQRFAEDHLRPKLAKVLEDRGDVVKQIEEYEKLRGSVELLSERKKNHVKTMVNIGCDIYMQAAVPDTTRIMVSIGLGFFAEFTLQEALEFIAVKCDHLQKRADALGQEASEISANIEVVLKGIQELMALPEPTQPQRHFL